MEYFTLDDFSQYEYNQLMEDIIDNELLVSEFDRYFPSASIDQGYAYPSERSRVTTPDRQQTFTELKPLYPTANQDQILSPSSIDMSPSPYSHSDNHNETIYNVMQCGMGSFHPESPLSPADSSSAGSASDTESTGVPATLLPNKTNGRTQNNSRARRTNRRKKGKLWEFLLDLLMSEETNPSIIRWEDKSKGIFKILDCAHVAYLWGKRKSNPSMTYEKLSRALRYYYDLNILVKLEGQKLLYKFGDLTAA